MDLIRLATELTAAKQSRDALNRLMIAFNAFDREYPTDKCSMEVRSRTENFRIYIEQAKTGFDRSIPKYKELMQRGVSEIG
jgi:hypothetical protein